MPAIITGIEAWGYIKKEETKEIERIQGKVLKRIFKLPLSTAYTEIWMETAIWPAEQRICIFSIDKVTGKKKSTWKKEVKEKVISKLKKRMSTEMAERTKC